MVQASQTTWYREFLAARRFGEKHGIEIYNATRGGHLEIFKRVDFDKIFKEDGNEYEDSGTCSNKT